MTAAIAGAVMGRPSAARLTERLERARLRIVVLTDELRALVAERATLAAELFRLSRRLELAVIAERPDIAMHVAGRLDALGTSISRRAPA